MKSTVKSNLLWFRETLSATYQILKTTGGYSHKNGATFENFTREVSFPVIEG